MLSSAVRNLFNLTGFSLHKKSSIDQLLRDHAHLSARLNALLTPVTIVPVDDLPAGTLEAECHRLRLALREHENRRILYTTAEDYDSREKTERGIDGIARFGSADFAELAPWLFASSLLNHRLIHQRIDEASLLWQAAKMTSGAILEIGTAFGGSTVVLLGASGVRPVVSIDRGTIPSYIADRVFKRPDVAPRLKLYRQSSRDRIAESEFGMLFVDADHSYEGVCHDIATFWNGLKSFDGKPPLAAFHDAADNPIAFVLPVKQACDELLAEPGVARRIESWGSMLVVEKTGDIDPDRWFKKEDPAFWQQYADPEHPVLKAANIRDRLYPDRHPPSLGTVNLLGDENVDHESWTKNGLTIERAELNEDSPVRLLRETPESGEHGIEKNVRLNVAHFNFLVFLRPHRLRHIRLSVVDPNHTPLAETTFDLANRSRVGQTFAKDGVEILDAGFLYRNGYFGCEIAVRLSAAIPSAILAVRTLDPDGGTVNHPGNPDRGFFVNLSSVREIL